MVEILSVIWDYFTVNNFHDDMDDTIQELKDEWSKPKAKLAAHLEAFDFDQVRTKEWVEIVQTLVDEMKTNINDFALLNENIAKLQEYFTNLALLTNATKVELGEMKLERVLVALEKNGVSFNRFRRALVQMDFESLTPKAKERAGEQLAAIIEAWKDREEFMKAWRALQSVIKDGSVTVKAKQRKVWELYSDRLNDKIPVDNWSKLEEDVYELLEEEGTLSDAERKEVSAFLINVEEHARKTDQAIKWVGNILDWAQEKIDTHKGWPITVTFNSQSKWGYHFNELISVLWWVWFHHVWIKGDALDKGGEFSLNFSSKEEAQDVLDWLYDILDDAGSSKLFSNTDWWVLDMISSWGLSAISSYNSIVLNWLDAFVSWYSLAIEEGNLIMWTLIYWWLTAVGWISLNRFLKQLDTWVPPERFTELTKSIRDNIKIYEAAGRSKDAADLKKLADEIENTFKQTAEWWADSMKNARQVYMLLQTFRGNSLMDFWRYTTAHLWNFFDGTVWAVDASWASLNRERGFFRVLITEAKNLGSFKHVVRNLWNLYRTPWMFFVKAFNKGPDGGIAWWNFQSKWAVVLNYLDKFNANSEKFKILYGVIDSIEWLDKDEKIEVKSLILDEYGSSIWKHDILKRWKFDFSNLKMSDFKDLNELVSEGLEAKWKPRLTTDTWKRGLLKGLTELFPWPFFKVIMGYLKQYNIARPNIMYLNEESARVLAEYLDSKGILNDGSLNTRIIDRLTQSDSARENVDIDIKKARGVFASVIEHHPEIPGDIEKKLLLDIEVWALLSGDVNDFQDHVIAQVDISELSDYKDFETLSKEFIDNTIIVEGKTHSNIMNNFEKIIIWKFPADIVGQKIDMLGSVFKLNKTFYVPHLSLLIEWIIDDWTILDITMADVRWFVAWGYSGWYRSDVISFLDSKKESIEGWPLHPITGEVITPEEARVLKVKDNLRTHVDDMIDRVDQTAAIDWDQELRNRLPDLRQLLYDEIWDDSSSTDIEHYKNQILTTANYRDIATQSQIDSRRQHLELQEQEFDTLRQSLRAEIDDMLKRVEWWAQLDGNQDVVNEVEGLRNDLHVEIASENFPDSLDHYAQQIRDRTDNNTIPTYAEIDDKRKKIDQERIDIEAKAKADTIKTVWGMYDRAAIYADLKGMDDVAKQLRAEKAARITEMLSPGGTIQDLNITKAALEWAIWVEEIPSDEALDNMKTKFDSSTASPDAPTAIPDSTPESTDILKKTPEVILADLEELKKISWVFDLVIWKGSFGIAEHSTDILQSSYTDFDTYIRTILKEYKFPDGTVVDVDNLNRLREDYINKSGMKAENITTVLDDLKTKSMAELDSKYKRYNWHWGWPDVLDRIARSI